MQKVRQAESAAANAVIIADNVDEQSDLIMADDGSGGKISIPSLFLHKTDADRLKAAMKKGETIMMKLQWAMPHPDNHVEWTMFTSRYHGAAIHTSHAHKIGVRHCTNNTLPNKARHLE